MSRSSRLAGVAPVGAALALTQGTMALAGILSARALGPDGKGVVAAVATWATVLVFISLAGMSYAASVQVAGAPERVEVAVANSLLHAVLAGGLVATIAVATLPETFERLGSEASSASVWALLAIPVGIAGECLLSILLALERRSAFFRARLAGAGVLLGVTCALVAVDRLTVRTAVLAFVAGWVATAALALLALPWRRLRPQLRPFIADLRFGLKVHLGYVLNVTALRLDLLVMSLVLSATQIGYYSVATNVLAPVVTLSNSVALLLTPAVARRAARQHDDDFQLGRTARRYVSTLVATAGLVAVAVPVAIPVLFGAAFEPSVQLVWILAPGLVALGYADMIAAAAVGLRTPWVANVVHLVGVGVTALLLPPLLLSYESTGAAITSTAAYSASAATAWLLARHLTPQLARRVDTAPAPVAALPSGAAEY